MLPLFTAILSLTAPILESPDPLPSWQRDGARTSTKSLQFSPQRPSDDEKERNRQRIGISLDQQKQIDDLYKETRARMDEVRKAMQDVQKKLWDEYEKYDIDEAAIKSLRREINRQHWRFGEVQADNERRLRKILTREQFEKLRALMKEQFEKRRQEMQQRRGGPGGRPPGGPG